MGLLAEIRGRPPLRPPLWLPAVGEVLLLRTRRIIPHRTSRKESGQWKGPAISKFEVVGAAKQDWQADEFAHSVERRG